MPAVTAGVEEDSHDMTDVLGNCPSSSSDGNPTLLTQSSPQQTVEQDGGLLKEATYEIKKYCIFQLAYCLFKVPYNIALIKTLSFANDPLYH